MSRMAIKATPDLLAKAKVADPVPGWGRMNRLERGYALHLCEQVAWGKVRAFWFEGVTLRLGHDARYTPDFLVQLADGSMELHETKGFMREAANVRLQVCARTYPFPVKLVKAVPKSKNTAFTIAVVEP